MEENHNVRTDMICTECHHAFIAQLDMSVEGNHIILCPWCEHEHCRVVKNGEVTGERWDSRAQKVDVKKICVWKSGEAPIMTSTAAAFIRNSWLNRLDVQL